MHLVSIKIQFKYVRIALQFQEKSRIEGLTMAEWKSKKNTYFTDNYISQINDANILIFT